MERLTGLDASFLYNETPTIHMHTLKIAVLDPAPGTPSLTHDFLREQLERRLHLLPVFRRRLVEVPFRFHHPVWIEDPDLDLDYHVRRLTVPTPGGREEMDRLIADIAGWPLDRRRPLWQLYSLDGRADGRLGVLIKIHHCVADGVAAAELLMNAMTTAASEIEPPSERESWRPDPLPGNWELLFDGLVDRLRLIGRLPTLLWLTLRNLLTMVRVRRETGVAVPRPILDAPRTPFNVALTPHRSFATTQLSLPEAKRIRRAHRVTVNDVVLGVVGGALRGWLADRDQLPALSLVASVPTSTDEPDARRLGGNRVSNIFTLLGTDIADPAERLQVVHRVTAAAKRANLALGPRMMGDWVEYTPPRTYSWFVKQYGRHRLADLVRPPVNVIVSNVPGPRDRLYAAGARLAELYSVGPILEGIGLNITFWSYLDDLNVGVLACREAVPDAREIARRLHESMAEMLAQSEERRRDPAASAGPGPIVSRAGRPGGRSPGGTWARPRRGALPAAARSRSARGSIPWGSSRRT